jgi:hypothetical protein
MSEDENFRPFNEKLSNGVGLCYIAFIMICEFFIFNVIIFYFHVYIFYYPFQVSIATAVRLIFSKKSRNIFGICLVYDAIFGPLIIINKVISNEANYRVINVFLKNVKKFYFHFFHSTDANFSSMDYHVCSFQS